MQKFVVLNNMNISIANCNKDVDYKDKAMFVKYVPIARFGWFLIVYYDCWKSIYIVYFKWNFRNDISESMLNNSKTEFDKSTQIENDTDYYGHESMCIYYILYLIYIM